MSLSVFLLTPLSACDFGDITWSSWIEEKNSTIEQFPSRSPLFGTGSDVTQTDLELMT